MINSDKNSMGEPIVFSSDGLKLAGRLHRPTADRPPFVIGSHGLFSTGDSPKQLALANALSRAGIAFFRFDHRGCGRSGGSFRKETSLAARCADLLSALEVLHRRTDLSTRFGLFGSSFGGTVCLATAAEAGASALAVNAAPVRSRTLAGTEVAADGPPDLDDDFYREALRFDVSSKLSSVHTVCVFHGDADRVVPIENGMEIFEKARDPKRITVFEQGDHRMSRGVHQRRFVTEAADWFTGHLIE
jgi:dipeptidyl aminopeptidase/acylaminoacyl peptidase